MHTSPARRPRARTALTRHISTILGGGALVLLSLSAGRLCLAQDFQAEFARLSSEAAEARRAGDLAAVEEARIARWRLVREASRGGKIDSPFVAAYRAIEEVDGTFEKPGLVDQLKYDEAIRLLLTTWKSMLEVAPQGPLLGEVACRIFEAQHQKIAIFQPQRDGPTASEKERATDRKLLEILEKAHAADPCCIAVIPMIEWIKPLDPKEAFLRAEVRPSMKTRQNRLLEISHPLIWREASRDESPLPGAGPPPADGAAKTPPAGADSAILPWHAPVEFAKARTLRVLLDETETLDPVLSNWFSLSRGVMVPRTPLRGRTATGAPFELLYGRLLITSVVNQKGARRSAALTCDRRGRWHQHYVEILYREPPAIEIENPQTDEAKRQTRLKRLLDSLESVTTWEIEGKTVRLCTWPTHNTDKLLAEGVRLLCVNDSLRLPKLKTGRHEAFSKEVEALAKTADDHFPSDPQIIDHINLSLIRKDRTSHPLAELLDRHNPIAIVSETSEPTIPDFFVEDSGACFLKLEDESRLYVRSTGENAPSAEIATAHGRFTMPLHLTATPRTALLGSGAGRCMMSILRQAQFDEREAEQAIIDFVTSYGKKVPSRFKRWVETKGQSNKVESLENTIRVGKSDPLEELWRIVTEARANELGFPKTEHNTTGANGKSKYLVPQEFQSVHENGSQDNRIWFSTELVIADQLFGFRYFTTPRGSIVYAAELGNSRFLSRVSSAYQFLNSASSQSVSRPVFQFVEPSGQQIPHNQFYTEQEFRSIKGSIYAEHLAKALLFSPSFGTFTAIADDRAAPFMPPDDRMPAYLVEKKDPAPQSHQGQSKALEGDDIPTLAAPILKSDIGDDPAQLQTLSALHNAYVELVAIGTSRLEEAGRIVQEVEDRETFLTELGENVFGLLSIQLESARYYSRAGKYHRAIVYYNDLLKVLRPGSLTSPYVALLDSVPDTSTAARLVEQLRTQVGQVRLLMTLQTELAATLAKAGLKDSANAILSQSLNNWDKLIAPSLRRVEEILRAYGVVMPPNYEEAVNDLKNLSRVSAELIDRFELAINWRSPKVAKPGDAADVIKRAHRLRALLDKMEGQHLDKLSADESAEYDVLARADRETPPTEFRSWLARKQILIDHPRIGGAVPIDASYDIRFATPADYLAANAAGDGGDRPDDDTGRFEDKDEVLRRFIQSADLDRILEWCQLPREQADQEKDVVQNTFLLAWFWMDQEDNARVREALLSLARHFDRRADAAGEETPVGLAARLNGFRASACANCFGQSYPGVNAARVDFTDALRLQVLFWERTWNAQALPASLARREAAGVNRMITDAGKGAVVERVVGTSNRYFFPDYRCRWGGVPDFVAREVIDRKGQLRRIILDSLLKPEQVAGNAVPEGIQEDRDWILVNEKQALDALKVFPLRNQLDRKVLGLGAD